MTRCRSIGTLLRTRKANFAPRVGLTWMPDADGPLIVRVGSGIFYDINTLPFVAQTVGGNPPYFNQVTRSEPQVPETRHPGVHGAEPRCAVVRLEDASPGPLQRGGRTRAAVEDDAGCGICGVPRQQSGSVGGYQRANSRRSARWHEPVRCRKTAPEPRVRRHIAAIDRRAFVV